MNGYEAARAIRQLPGLADVRIIAATEYGQDVDHQKSREAGFDHHLVKPIDLDALLQALQAERTTHTTPDCTARGQRVTTDDVSASCASPAVALLR